jgi:hypothetical protein
MSCFLQDVVAPYFHEPVRHFPLPPEGDLVRGVVSCQPIRNGKKYCRYVHINVKRYPASMVRDLYAKRVEQCLYEVLAEYFSDRVRDLQLEKDIEESRDYTKCT